MSHACSMEEWADVKADIIREVPLELKNSAIIHCNQINISKRCCLGAAHTSVSGAIHYIVSTQL